MDSHITTSQQCQAWGRSRKLDGFSCNWNAFL